MLKVPALTVALEEIPPEGLEFGLEAAPEAVAELAAEAADMAAGRERPDVLSPLTGAFRLSLAGRRLRVKGAFQVRVTLACDRCLNEAPADLAEKVDEVLELGGPEAAEFEDEDLDGRLPVENGRVDLAPLLAELFWLARPYQFICRPDCAGLCPRCGADLNQGSCGCRA